MVIEEEHNTGIFFVKQGFLIGFSPRPRLEACQTESVKPQIKEIIAVDLLSARESRSQKTGSNNWRKKPQNRKSQIKVTPEVGNEAFIRMPKGAKLVLMGISHREPSTQTSLSFEITSRERRRPCLQAAEPFSKQSVQQIIHGPRPSFI